MHPNPKPKGVSHVSADQQPPWTFTGSTSSARNLRPKPKGDGQERNHPQHRSTWSLCGHRQAARHLPSPLASGGLQKEPHRAHRPRHVGATAGSHPTRIRGLRHADPAGTGCLVPAFSTHVLTPRSRSGTVRLKTGRARRGRSARRCLIKARVLRSRAASWSSGRGRPGRKCR